MTKRDLYLYVYTYSQSQLGWHFRKLKAQSSNVSFATFQWKETFDLWALCFETAFENVTPSGIGSTYVHINDMSHIWICHIAYIYELVILIHKICTYVWISTCFFSPTDLLHTAPRTVAHVAVRIYVRIFVRTYVYMHVCMYVCMYQCMYVWVHVFSSKQTCCPPRHAPSYTSPLVHIFLPCPSFTPCRWCSEIIWEKNRLV